MCCLVVAHLKELINLTSLAVDVLDLEVDLVEDHLASHNSTINQDAPKTMVEDLY